MGHSGGKYNNWYSDGAKFTRLFLCLTYIKGHYLQTIGYEPVDIMESVCVESTSNALTVYGQRTTQICFLVIAEELEWE